MEDFFGMAAGAVDVFAGRGERRPVAGALKLMGVFGPADFAAPVGAFGGHGNQSLCIGAGDKQTPPCGTETRFGVPGAKSAERPTAVHRRGRRRHGPQAPGQARRRPWSKLRAGSGIWVQRP